MRLALLFEQERATLRFDPEGIRVGLFGTFFISDEYGPDVFEFGRFGHLFRRLDVPDKFHISSPNADPNLELLGNTSGRQANRGMEGLAISPNDRFCSVCKALCFRTTGLTQVQRIAWI